MIRKYFLKSPNIKIQWRIIYPVILLVLIGLVTLYGTKDVEILYKTNFFKQCIFLIISIISFYLLQFLRISFFYETAYLFYILLQRILG